jgi:hypothetical protein
MQAASQLERRGNVPQRQLRRYVAIGLLPSGQLDVPVGQRLAGDLAEQVAADVEPGALLVVAAATYHGAHTDSVEANMASRALE